MNILLQLRSTSLPLALLFVFSSFNLEAQEDSVMYSSSFRFETGIYLTYQEFKNNDPAIKEKPVKTENIGSQIMFGNIFQNEKIGYTDSLGIRRKLPRRKM